MAEAPDSIAYQSPGVAYTPAELTDIQDTLSDPLYERQAIRPSSDRVRQLSKDQQEALGEELKERGLDNNKVAVRFYGGHEECKRYAAQLAEAMSFGGWQGEISTTLDERHDLTGLRLCIPDMDAKPRSANILAAAFRQAKIDFEWWQWNGLGDQIIVFVYPQKQMD